MSRTKSWPVVIATVMVCMVVGCDVHGRRTYQDYVALDGKGPSLIMDRKSGASDDVVLYRSGRNGVICYDVFRSRELHDFLLPKNGNLVTVEYDTFSDFGKVRGYKVHSVDGKLLANDLAGGAGIAGRGPGSAGGNDCW